MKYRKISLVSQRLNDIRNIVRETIQAKRHKKGEITNGGFHLGFSSTKLYYKKGFRAGLIPQWPILVLLQPHLAQGFNIAL